MELSWQREAVISAYSFGKKRSIDLPYAANGKGVGR